MGFWLFMLAMDLLIPLIMLGIGRYFMKTAPGKINHLFGYRTTMSMKNRETWEFAHAYCGRIWFVCGLALLPISALAMLPLLGKGEDLIGTVGSAITLLQLIPLIVSVVLTEKALKQNFDQNGNRR